MIMLLCSSLTNNSLSNYYFLSHIFQRNDKKCQLFMDGLTSLSIIPNKQDVQTIQRKKKECNHISQWKIANQSQIQDKMR